MYPVLSVAFRGGFLLCLKAVEEVEKEEEQVINSAFPRLHKSCFLDFLSYIYQCKKVKKLLLCNWIDNY